MYEAIWGGHEAYTLPGEQALAAVISKDIAGATVVTRFVRLYLDALGVRYSTTRIGSVQIIEIEGCQVGIATLAATSEAPRGYALPVIVLDEYAHHPIGDEYAASAGKLLDAAIPAQMQFENALLIGISTPLAKIGTFHERVEASLGNDEDEEAQRQNELSNRNASRTLDGQLCWQCAQWTGAERRTHLIVHCG